MNARKINELAGRLGPGLITGAADDDPSGIATYSQAGSQFRFGLVWTLLLTTPLMIGIQMLSARIGWVTGQGLAANIAKVCPRWLTLGLVSLLVVANTINIAADIGAMAEAARLLVGGYPILYIALFGAASVLGQVYFSYEKSVRILKWLTLALFSYFAVVMVAHVPLKQALVESMEPWRYFPKGVPVADYASMVVAVLGTTISPYLFFWQAAQEVEDSSRRPDAAELRDDRAYAREHLARIKLDTYIGMLFSNAIALCIVIATAVTLNMHGISNIQTSSQAAEALRPVAGEFAFALFALGIIGTGLLAVPVLAGSAAYAVSESLQPWAHFPPGVAASDYASMVVAVLGTTISPYLFFWQASQEVEDSNRRPDAAALRSERAYAEEHLYRIKQDTYVGMLFSNAIALCIVVATAVTLNEHGITNIQTSAQAAEALRPVAGEFAFAVFALGIIGTGLLAVPVLAGSAAYAVSEVFGWKSGLSHGFHEARGFYAIIISATGIGTLMSVFELDPIKALLWSAIVNGVISVPIMAVMMWIGQSARLMGALTISLRHRFFGWAATGLMAVAVTVMLLTGF